ncbi:hypothetical protein PR202_gb00668 [Eleusine coracana subsp. coracana]|uniref:Uncharacterized protein n=1 Tax=Eleusine coracana subsp. coracana TaxID=191504 RepID=A0AAV5DU08_ELECO|nr:hypothetical protein PR202_gb00668 [Eleusine coracana subsp. coracana]
MDPRTSPFIVFVVPVQRGLRSFRGGIRRNFGGRPFGRLGCRQFGRPIYQSGGRRFRPFRGPPGHARQSVFRRLGIAGDVHGNRQGSPALSNTTSSTSSASSASLVPSTPQYINSIVHNIDLDPQPLPMADPGEGASSGVVRLPTSTPPTEGPSRRLVFHIRRQGGLPDGIAFVEPPSGEVPDLNRPAAVAGPGPQAGPPPTMAARSGVPPFYTDSPTISSGAPTGPPPSALPTPTLLLNNRRSIRRGTWSPVALGFSSTN